MTKKNPSPSGPSLFGVSWNRKVVVKSRDTLIGVVENALAFSLGPPSVRRNLVPAIDALPLRCCEVGLNPVLYRAEISFGTVVARANRVRCSRVSRPRAERRRVERRFSNEIMTV